MSTSRNVTTQPALTGIRRRPGTAAVTRRPSTPASLLLPGLVLAVAAGFALPPAVLAQDPTPAPAPGTVTIPEEIREAMERMRAERTTLMELMRDLERDELAAARELMRELRSEEDRLFGPVLGLQGRQGPGAGEQGLLRQGQGMQGQRGQGMQGQRDQGMQGQRGQGMMRQGQGMQGQRGQGMRQEGQGMQRQGQQLQGRSLRQEAGPRGQIGASVLLPGVRLHSLNPALGRYFQVDSGILVLEVVESSFLPLEPGDVIQGIDGREPEDPAHLRRILMGYRVGESFTVELIRGGERLELTVEAPGVPESGA